MKKVTYKKGSKEETTLAASKDVGVVAFELIGINTEGPLLRVCADGELAGKAIVLNAGLRWLLRESELGEQLLIPRKRKGK